MLIEYDNYNEESWKDDEKYYWRTKDGEYIKVDDITNEHLVNIVLKFGKDKLENNGYYSLVKRFNKILFEKLLDKENK